MFQQVWPHLEPDKQILYNHLSYLTKLCERFLVHQRIMNSETTFQLQLTAELHQRGLNHLSKQTLSYFSKSVEGRPQRDDSFFNLKYLIAKENDLAFLGQDKHARDDSLHQKDEYLDKFYLATKLKVSCEILNRANIISIEQENPLLPVLMDYIANNNALLEEFPAITIYFQIAKTLLEPEVTAHFYKLKKLLKHEVSKFSPEEAKAMYGYAQNYCIKAANKGSAVFLNELFELYKTMLAQQFFLQQTHISEWEYKNIVTVACRLKAFDWADGFIRNFREKLKPAEMENAYRYNLANLHYSRKQYDNALELLRDVEFTDVFYKLGSRSLLLKIYYECDETEALVALLDSFKNFIHRNKNISTYQKNIHFNLLKEVKRLFRIKMRVGFQRKQLLKQQLGKLKKRIKENPEIANLQWLNEKIGELEGG